MNKRKSTEVQRLIESQCDSERRYGKRANRNNVENQKKDLDNRSGNFVKSKDDVLRSLNGIERQSHTIFEDSSNITNDIKISIKEEETTEHSNQENEPHLHVQPISTIINGNFIDEKTDAILPPLLKDIYHKFITNGKYLEYLQAKDTFYAGVGLFGIGIEEKIYKRRQKMEDSLKRGFRLRPNPKPTKLFDGTVLNRPKRQNELPVKPILVKTNVIRNRNRFNLFNIGKDMLKRKSKQNIKRPVRKRPPPKPKSTPVKLPTESVSEDVNEKNTNDSSSDTETPSLALTRTKRKLKGPHLEFKYCYESSTYVKNKKPKEPECVPEKVNVDSEDDALHIVIDTEEEKTEVVNKDAVVVKDASKKDEEVPVNSVTVNDSEKKGTEEKKKEAEEVHSIDSDSSSVVEVSPPNNDESHSTSTMSSDSSKVKDVTMKSAKRPRKAWKPKQHKALNLLDKLLLGLQCTIIQTEADIIIQNLRTEDLATLQSRLHGLASFKNIEAEHDKSGQETARATIDRRALNIPMKPSDTNISSTPSFASSVIPSTSSEGKNIGLKRYFDSLKRKLSSGGCSEQLPKYCRKPVLSAKPLDLLKPLSSVPRLTNDIAASLGNNWMRSKCRSVRKVRKLYTQSGSTPNILARSSQLGTGSSSSYSNTNNSGPNNSNSAGSSVKTHGLPFVHTNFRLSSVSSSAVVDSSTIMHHSALSNMTFYPQLTGCSAGTATATAVVTPIIATHKLVDKIQKQYQHQQDQQQKTTDDDVHLMGLANPVASNQESSTASNLPSAPPSTSVAEEPSSETVTTSTTSSAATTSTPQTAAESAEPKRATQPVPADSVCPATALSASQLLMLKKGGGTHPSDSGTGSSPGSQQQPSMMHISSTDQFLANQILKPFKKQVMVSSPPKLEIDEEEPDAEGDMTSYPANLTVASSSSSGLTASSSSSITPCIVSLPTAAGLSPARGLACSTPATTTFISKPLIQASSGVRRTVPVIQLPNAASSTMSRGPSLAPGTISLSSGATPTSSGSGCVTIKHRKYTHNFLMSSNINFREVLCHNRPPRPPFVSTTVTPAVVTASSCAPLTPSKSCSSAVLKSLLVGSGSGGGTPTLVVRRTLAPARSRLVPVELLPTRVLAPGRPSTSRTTRTTVCTTAVRLSGSLGAQ